MRATSIENLSVKIRLLDSTQATISLIRALFDLGVDAITLHARKMSENRDVDAAHMDTFALIFNTIKDQYLKNGEHYLIYNGNIFSPLDYRRLSEVCGLAQEEAIPVMIARGFLRYPGLMR